MMKPRIHLNGTSAAELFNSYSDAAAAIRDAEIALIKAGPNARDYYPIGGDAYTIARQEHSQRLQKLKDIGRELNEILEHVSDELDRQIVRIPAEAAHG